MFSTFMNALKIWNYGKIVFLLCCRYMVCYKLNKIKNGRILLIEFNNNGEVRFEKEFGDKDELKTTIFINNRIAYWMWLTTGDIGLGESFAKNYWTTSDLERLLRILSRNIDNLNSTLTWLVCIPKAIKHRILRKNSIEESRKSISAHYDLTNELFESFLDEKMQYSCGIFRHETDTTLDASLNKMYFISETLKIESTDIVLDIGCGWGQLAIYIAQNYGAKVLGITTSVEQLKYCNERLIIENEKTDVDLLSLVSYELIDYRELSDADNLRSFNKIVSIEMIEHVGKENLDDYLNTIYDVMSKDGLAFIQGIMIPDERYDKYSEGTDFIKEFIFPGGHLFSDEDFNNGVDCAYLEVIKSFSVTEHYSRMCRMWAEDFADSDVGMKIGKLYFFNIWYFYLMYSSAGFSENIIHCNQYLLKHSDM